MALPGNGGAIRVYRDMRIQSRSERGHAMIGV
jgi:hypothetical protein